MNLSNMKIIFFLFAISVSCTTVFADSNKVITLSDGTKIIGKVVSLKDNVYSIESTQLGTVQIAEDKIVSIAAEGAPNIPVITSANALPAVDPAQLKQQAQDLQQKFLADEGLMKEIENLMNDEEIKKILSDPDVLNAILSYDPQNIQNNQKINQLMQNPKFKELLDKMQSKFSPAK